MNIRIAGREIGDGCPCYIVAEIGQNHNGDAYAATRLMGMAHECGADAVKFQLRDCEAEYPAEVLDSPHPNPAAAFGETYREHRQAIDFTIQDIAHCATRIQYNEWPLTWFCTPCFPGAVEQLEGIGCPAYKIASKDLTNTELIEEAARTEKPVILSTGMDGLQEIERALMAVYRHSGQAIVLQCTSSYPCEPEDVHLRTMAAIRAKFNVLVGFSDHTVGVSVAPAAVALGACLVEKHITPSRAMKGTDHAGSLERGGLERVCRYIRTVEQALGDPEKVPLAVADAARRKLRA